MPQDTKKTTTKHSDEVDLVCSSCGKTESLRGANLTTARNAIKSFGKFVCSKCRRGK